MQPHYSQSSRENVTPSSGTSPLLRSTHPPGAAGERIRLGQLTWLSRSGEWYLEKNRLSRILCCLDKSWVSKDFILLSEIFVKGHICGFLYALTLWPFHCAVSDKASVASFHCRTFVCKRFNFMGSVVAHVWTERGRVRHLNFLVKLTTLGTGK